MEDFSNFSLGDLTDRSCSKEDLFYALYDEAKRRFPNSPTVKDIDLVVKVLDNVDDHHFTRAFYNTGYCEDSIALLHDLLNRDLPPFVYFGTRGSRLNYGYYFDNSDYECSVLDGETLVANDLSDIDFDNLSEDVWVCAVVNDHGNIDFYDRNGKHLYGVV